jgi:hypothetical protein
VGLVAPELLSPIDGEVITEDFAKLRYQPGEPRCIPDGYFINLQPDATFSGTNLLGEFMFPGTTTFTDTLADCTIYWWKVAAIQGSSYGPESAPEWFYTNYSGTCPAPAGPMMAAPLRDLACYLGPGYDYPQTGGYLLVGEITEALGRNRLGNWLALQGLDGYGRCWVLEEDVDTTGEPDDLREFPDPEKPKPDEPKPDGPVCTPNLDARACQAAGGTWYAVCPGGGYLTTPPPCCVCP